MLLSLRGIQKNYGGVKALRNGNLDVNPGEVHLLMGENGAGKSTMMKIVAGMTQHDGGEMLWQGRSVSFAESRGSVGERDCDGASGIVAGAAFERCRKHFSGP